MPSTSAKHTKDAYERSVPFNTTISDTRAHHRICTLTRLLFLDW